MSETIPVTPPPIAKFSIWQQMAHASWLCAVAGLVVIVIGSVVNAFYGSHSLIGSGIGLIVLFLGFVLGIAALFSIARYGKKGILWPAIIGICLNIPFIVVGVASLLFDAISGPRVHLGPVVHSTSARLLTNDRLRFSMDIPNGFAEFPSGRQDPNDECSYIQHFAERNTDLAFVIRRRDGLVPQGILTAAQLGPDFKGEILHPDWRGVTLNATLEVAMNNGLTSLTYSILVPLKPNAIQLIIIEAGPAPKKEDVENLGDNLLASLEGQTNW